MFYFIGVDQAQTFGCACSKRKCAQDYVSVNFSSFQSMTLQRFLGCITCSTKHFNFYAVTVKPFLLVSFFDFDHKPVERLPFTIVHVLHKIMSRYSPCSLLFWISSSTSKYETEQTIFDFLLYKVLLGKDAFSPLHLFFFYVKSKIWTYRN